MRLFGHIFPQLGSQKHRHQLLEHFIACIKSAKAGPRRQAIQINIFAAFLAALKGKEVYQSVPTRAVWLIWPLKGIGAIKGKLGSEKVMQTAKQLSLSTLTQEDATLRCAAAEAVGRMGQVGDQGTHHICSSWGDGSLLLPVGYWWLLCSGDEQCFSGEDAE